MQYCKIQFYFCVLFYVGLHKKVLRFLFYFGRNCETIETVAVSVRIKNTDICDGREGAVSMLFDKKVKRVIDVEKAEEEFEERMEGVELDKKDRPAMIIAAFIVFIPALLLVLGAFLLVIWFFFLRHM